MHVCRFAIESIRGKPAEWKHKNYVTVQMPLALTAVTQYLINKSVAWLQITAFPTLVTLGFHPLSH